MSGDDRMKKVEGAIESAHHDCTGKSALQVSRNAEQALKSVGFTIDLAGCDLRIATSPRIRARTGRRRRARDDRQLRVRRHRRRDRRNDAGDVG